MARVGCRASDAGPHDRTGACGRKGAAVLVEDDDVIASVEALRRIYPPPRALVERKQLTRLDKHARTFIAHSPFLVLATADAEGRTDASPRGDTPGFVAVADDRTLELPDRIGNNRVDSLRNIIANPRVGLVFFVPGRDETLRVNGRARIRTAAPVLERHAAQGKLPRSVIEIAAEEVYFHCGKALIRSGLWSAEAQAGADALPSLGRMLADQIAGEDAETLERGLAESYAQRLY